MIQVPKPTLLRKKISVWLGKLSQTLSPVDLDAPAAPHASERIDGPPDNCGSAIFDLGWLQGSFISREVVSLPDKCASLSSDSKILLCSQSCTVVSPDLKRDPYVEVIIGRPIKKYNQRSPEATGKNQRKLHLKVEGLSGAEALEISINDRFEVPRQVLLAVKPSVDLKLFDRENIKLTNWLARNYSRIAVPNSLVGLLKEKFFPQIDAWFKSSLDGDDSPLHHYITTIYMAWEPDEEDTKYTLRFIFLTDNAELQKDFHLKFVPTISDLTREDSPDIKIVVLECLLKEEVFLSDLDGYHRFSEYDHLTSLDEWQTLSVVK